MVKLIIFYHDDSSLPKLFEPLEFSNLRVAWYVKTVYFITWI